MRNKTLGAAIMFAGLLGASSANAQEAITADRQCLAFSLYFAGEEKQDLKDFGAMGAFFFLGRLQGRGPEAASGAALKTFIEGLTEENLMAQGDRCLNEFKTAADTFASFDDAKGAKGAE